jgi:hypothetical protein
MATSMITRKIQTRKVLNGDLMPLMVATLLTCTLILTWLMSSSIGARWRVLNPLTAAGCTSEVWKTPAVYFEHIGDEDKPINSIVIAASRPNERELDCGARRLWMSPEVFLVADEELSHVKKLLKGIKPSGEGTAESKEFRYVLVSKLGTVESGILDRTQSHEFFTGLAKFFDGRRPRPELHEYLDFVSRRF